MLNEHIEKVKDFIIDHCKRTAKRYTKETGKEYKKEDFQVRFSLPETNDSILYATAYKFGTKVEDTTFNKICNFTLGIDFLGYGSVVEPLIHNSLNHMAETEQIPFTELFVFAAPDDNYHIIEEGETEDENRVIMQRLAVHVYSGKEVEKDGAFVLDVKKTKYIKTITVEEFIMSNIMEGGLSL